MLSHLPFTLKRSNVFSRRLNMVALTRPPTKNVVVIGASYGESSAHFSHQSQEGRLISQYFHPTAGARAAELLSRTLPSTHRVVVIDRQR